MRVHAQLVLDGAAGDIVEGIVEDVSQRGLFLCTAQIADVGTPGVVRLELPEGRLTFPVRVVRVSTAPRAGLAMQLEGDRASLVLANFMMRCHASSQRAPGE